MNAYRSLDPQAILMTVDLLQKRIDERFPGRGIGRVCGDLGKVVREAQAKITWLNRPLWPLRLAIGLLLVMMVSLLVFTFYRLNIPIGEFTLTDFVQMVEAGINDMVFLGVAVFFLFTLEGRLKRQRALKALHELRSLAHVVDMHQLTKDPERLLKRWVKTPSSPVETMSAFELTRYLDYCSEMLSIVAKVAALYAQHLNDPVVLSAVNDIESLTNALARKIWQKIMIIGEGEAYQFLGSGE